MSLGEFELISGYFKQAAKSADVILDNGDDAAVVSCPEGFNLAVSTDTLVESVHFPVNANPELVARRALRVNLSDVAAMGATPKWFTLTLTLPEVDEFWLKSFSAGLFKDAETYGCELIGGDTTRGPLNIGIQMMGLVDSTQTPLTRSGAKAGDLLAVTGTLGDAGAALDLDLNANIDSNQEDDSDSNHLLNRYWLPSPRIAFAQKAAPYIHAALDISDGLVGDTQHICDQSELTAVIDLEAVPVSKVLVAKHEDDTSQAKQFALTSGDDYELCMAIPESNLSAVEGIAKAENLSLTVLGRLESSQDSTHSVHVVDKQGARLELAAQGYKHF